jgi:hypothetical protein
MISPFQMPESTATELLRLAGTDQRETEQAAQKELAAARSEIERIDQRINLLHEDRLDLVIDRDTFVSRTLEAKSKRKTLDEHCNTLLRRKNFWLEPFREWVSDATNLSKTMETGSQNERRALIQKIFGSNLSMKGKTGRGEAVNPWAFLAEYELASQTARLYAAARTYFMQPRPVGDTRRSGRQGAPPLDVR